MTVKVKSSFKKDQKEFNGLDHPAVVKALVESPLDRVYAVVLLETSKIEQNVEDGGTKVPTIRIVAVEPVDGEDAIQAKTILDRRFKRRTGRDSQPTLFDREDDGDEPVTAGAVLQGQIPFLEPQKATEPDADTPEEDDTDHEALAEVGGPDDESDVDGDDPWPGDADYQADAEPVAAASKS